MMSEFENTKNYQQEFGKFDDRKSSTLSHLIFRKLMLVLYNKETFFHISFRSD